jgi:hypothetical protein
MGQMDAETLELRKMKAEADVTEMDIARDTQLHWQTVSKVLNGKAGPATRDHVRRYLREKLTAKDKAAG